MFRPTFVSWLMMFTSVFADIISNHYDVTYGCDITYGIVLETAQNIRSLTQCSWRCDGNGPCISVKYDGIKSECYLNSYRLPFVNDTCTGAFEYAENIKSSNRKLINDNCTASNDCWVPQSRCLSGKCQCKPGYSYKYANESCVTSCESYGSTFTEDPGHFLNHSPELFLQNITTEACQLACVQENVECWAYAFDFIRGDCYIYAATAFMVPERYGKIAGLNLYQRNCQ